MKRVKLFFQTLLRTPYFWEILFIFLISLTPLLWYKSSQSLAVGHDLFFPLDPIANFYDRIHLWSTRFPLGLNQIQDLIALPIHGLDALISLLGFGLQITQKIVFIFWFFMIGLSAYYLASVVGPKSSFFRIFVSVFYIFNHYLLQAWFIAERPKFSMVIAIPIILALLIQVIEKRMRVKLALTLAGLTFFFFNGGSPPFFGGFMLVIGSALIYFSFLEGVFSSFVKFKRIVIFAFGLIIVFILGNFYWIFPLLLFVREDYTSSLSSVGGLSGIGDWILAISENASLFNLLRLQGFPDWYGTSHPYGKLFLTNTALLFSSFLLPLFAYIPLFLEKNIKLRRYILYFAILSVISLPFVAGSHPPFGGFFQFLVMNLPGFAMFRTPFYKFALCLWLSYSVLIAFGLHYLTERFLSLSVLAKSLIWIFCIVGVLAYNFPFFTGTFFQWQKPYSSMVDIPSYVFEFKDWVNAEKDMNGKILFLPPLNYNWKTDVYKWNYWSFSSLPSLFINKDIIINDRTLLNDPGGLVELYLNFFRENNPAWVDLNRVLGIKYVVLRRDFAVDAGIYSTYPIEPFQAVLDNNFDLIKTFGEWDVYELNDKSYQSVYATRDAINVYDYQNQNLHSEQRLKKEEIFAWKTISSADLVFFNESNNYSEGLPTLIYRQCEICVDRSFYLELPKVNILPNSLFYFIVKLREERLLKNLSLRPTQLIDFKLGLSIKRMAEIKTMHDLRINADIINKSLTEYNELINEINALLISLPQNQEKDQISGRAIAILEAENKVLLRLNSDGRYTSNEFNDALHRTAGILRDFYISNIKYVNIPEMLAERYYPVKITKAGDYNIYIQNIVAGQNDNLTFEIDGKKYNSQIKEFNGYFNLGNHFFATGEHILRINIPQIKNIAPFREVNLDINRGKYNCRDFSVREFVQGQKYKLSFLHKLNNLDISVVTVKVIQYLSDGSSKKEETQFKSHNTLGSFSSIIDVDRGTREFVLSFCSPTYVYYSDASIDYSNVEFMQVSTPSVVFVLSNALGKSIYSDIPSVAAQRIDQTDYKITIKNAVRPYFLVFPMRYDNRWTLYDEEGWEITTHTRANIFANAWYIDQKGDYNLTLKFKGQELQYYYYTVSIIAGLIFLSYSAFNLIKKKKK